MFGIMPYRKNIWSPANILRDMDEFEKGLWESLNEDNKVSLFVRYIDIETGKAVSKVINKYTK